MRVLLCEDDDQLARGLSRALKHAGHRVTRAADIAEALACIRDEVPELALVDMSLPDGLGTQIIARLRQHPAVGIIVVSAHGREQDRIAGLRAGADDYVTKPFSVAELLARIDGLARRTREIRRYTGTPDPTTIELGMLSLDTEARTVTIGARAAGGAHTTHATHALTQKEFEILRLLASRAGQPVTREDLLDRVWESTVETGTRSLDTHMATLRAKLGGSLTITTLRGIGYSLAEPADPEDPT
ncbi:MULTISPECIES: response regulator transcription factor [unclassified Pseudoclavibacter]|uniref:response regulator transcription factor n=1 Tax=unclassified Pseudoclavibacter TaxID=2615177 RepID=UPI001BAC8963|nr:response regulator transcription factor [Pseudoclavibacter sp. Marseille-Q4354]MBS3180086.1 response regulator transcription factor [Pseudoclavibacter sp. Marseille-Q4354]